MIMITTRATAAGAIALLGHTNFGAFVAYLRKVIANTEFVTDVARSTFVSRTSAPP
jgi:hypothetical protein